MVTEIKNGVDLKPFNCEIIYEIFYFLTFFWLWLNLESKHFIWIIFDAIKKSESLIIWSTKEQMSFSILLFGNVSCFAMFRTIISLLIFTSFFCYTFEKSYIGKLTDEFQTVSLAFLFIKSFGKLSSQNFGCVENVISIDLTLHLNFIISDVDERSGMSEASIESKNCYVNMRELISNLCLIVIYSVHGAKISNERHCLEWIISIATFILYFNKLLVNLLLISGNDTNIESLFSKFLRHCKADAVWTSSDHGPTIFNQIVFKSILVIQIIPTLEAWSENVPIDHFQELPGPPQDFVKP